MVGKKKDVDEAARESESARGDDDDEKEDTRNEYDENFECKNCNRWFNRSIWASSLEENKKLVPLVQ